MSINQGEINFKSCEDAFESISMVFYRIDKIANSAILINDSRDGEFEDPAYKQDCVYYQLEAIRNIAQKFEQAIDKLDFTELPKTDSTGGRHERNSEEIEP